MEHTQIRPGDRIALLVPGSAEYVDLVPRTATGKVRRLDLPGLLRP